MSSDDGTKTQYFDDETLNAYYKSVERSTGSMCMHSAWGWDRKALAATELYAQQNDIPRPQAFELLHDSFAPNPKRDEAFASYFRTTAEPMSNKQREVYEQKRLEKEAAQAAKAEDRRMADQLEYARLRQVNPIRAAEFGLTRPWVYSTRLGPK